MSHYSKNKNTIKSNLQARVERNKEYVLSRMSPCVDCGYFHPAAMDFHHVDKSTKFKGGVSKLSRGGYKLQTLQEELDKCVCLCSNCHRIRHATEGV